MQAQRQTQATMQASASRRLFLKLAALGGGASLFSATALLPRAMAAGGTDALLLTCMDYRLIDDVERYMNGRGMRDSYDHIILAGASLGAVTDKFPAWNRTFWEHVDIAIQLHKVNTAILMDHRDCGAYKVILGPEHATEAKLELDTHAKELRKLKGMVLEKHPTLKVETLLMALDGTVETVA